MEHFETGVRWAAVFVELLAVVIMVGFIFLASLKWTFSANKLNVHTYKYYRDTLGKALLIGLQMLVAADIMRTVVLDATLTNIVALGALVLVRTFLGWSLTVEIEGRWPWQGNIDTHSAHSTEAKSGGAP